MRTEIGFPSSPHSEKEMKKWVKSLPIVDSIEKLWVEGDWIPPATDAEKNKVVVAVIDTVARDLGNTRAVCRSSYIHPWFIDSFLNGELIEKWDIVSSMNKLANLSKEESSTLRLLKELRK